MSSQASLSQFARFVRRHAAVLGLVVVVTGAVAVSLYSKPSDESKPLQAKNSTAAGPQLDKFVTHKGRKTLPALIVQRADGTQVKISDIEGSLVLVNFWATWCAPCRKEMPQLDALAARYQDKNATIVTLSSTVPAPPKAKNSSMIWPSNMSRGFMIRAINRPAPWPLSACRPLYYWMKTAWKSAAWPVKPIGMPPKCMLYWIII